MVTVFISRDDLSELDGEWDANGFATTAQEVHRDSIARSEQALAGLEARNAELTKPVTDEELAGLRMMLGRNEIREAASAMIAARASGVSK